MSKPTLTRPRDPAAFTRGVVHTIHYNLSYLTQAGNEASFDPAAVTVVLLHGFPGDATDWQPTLESLGSTPALAFDMLGFGQSDHPWPADVTVWGHADTVNGALRSLGLRNVILVGYGLGGGVAQVLATRLAPDLTRGLVLVDSTAFQMAFNPNWPLPDMAKRQDPDAPHHTQLAELEASLRQTIPQGSAKPASISGAVLESFVRPWIDELGKELFFQQVRALIPSYQNAVGADLKNLDCPALVIWGEQDTILPLRWGEFLKRTMPTSRLEVVPEAGHLILHDAPTSVANLVTQFVRQGS